MSVRARNTTPEVAYNLLKRAAVATADTLAASIAKAAAGNTSYEDINGIRMTLQRWLVDFDSKKTTPGLASWAQTAEDDPAYDAVTEFTELRARAVAALTWINNNVPTSVTLGSPDTWSANSITVSTTFAPAQTGTLRAALQAFVDWVS